MKTQEFNQKYIDYLEQGHYGLDLYDQDFVDWLDLRFQDFIKQPGFTYSQIKEKFGHGRFYCTGLTIEQIREVEDKITYIYRTQYEDKKTR